MRARNIVENQQGSTLHCHNTGNISFPVTDAITYECMKETKNGCACSTV